MTTAIARRPGAVGEPSATLVDSANATNHECGDATAAGAMPNASSPEKPRTSAVPVLPYTRTPVGSARRAPVPAVITRRMPARIGASELGSATSSCEGHGVVGISIVDAQ